MELEYVLLSDPRIASSDRFARVHRAFSEAFADYALDMAYLTEERLKNRLIKNGVDFASSVGAFAGERMVGFTLIGVEQRGAALAAFDAATGIVAEHRGQGVAGRMFELARTRLAARGVEQFLLEVLSDNAAAIKAYRRTGFRVRRELDSYRADPAALRLPAALPPDLEIRPVERRETAEFASFADWPPSWETSFASIARIPDRVFLYGAWVAGRRAGLAVYYPGLRWIMIVVVKPGCRRRGIATALLSEIVAGPAREAPEVKVIDVEAADGATAAWLAKLGFERYVRQYEMELNLG